MTTVNFSKNDLAATLSGFEQVGSVFFLSGKGEGQGQKKALLMVRRAFNIY
jgi:hypothetical protein